MEIEVKNVWNALNLLRNRIVEDCNNQLLDKNLIKKFHTLIGKDLGENFTIIPSEFRKHNVTVGHVYKAPEHRDVESLINSFCEWSKVEFHCEKGQTFSTEII